MHINLIKCSPIISLCTFHWPSMLIIDCSKLGLAGLWIIIKIVSVNGSIIMTREIFTNLQYTLNNTILIQTLWKHIFDVFWSHNFHFFLHFNIIRAFLIAFSYYWRLTNLTYTEKIVEIKEDCYILDVPCRFSIMFLHFSYSSLLSSVNSNLQFVTSWFFLSECLLWNSLEFILHLNH